MNIKAETDNEAAESILQAITDIKRKMDDTYNSKNILRYSEAIKNLADAFYTFINR